MRIVSGADQQETNTAQTTSPSYKAYFGPIVLQLTRTGQPVPNAQVIYQVSPPPGGGSAQFNSGAKSLLSKQTDADGLVRVNDLSHGGEQKSVWSYYKGGAYTFVASVAALGVSASTTLTSVDLPDQALVPNAVLTAVSDVSYSGTLTFRPNSGRFYFDLPVLQVRVLSDNGSGAAVEGVYVDWEVTKKPAGNFFVQIAMSNDAVTREISNSNGVSSLEYGSGKSAIISTTVLSAFAGKEIEITARYGDSRVVFSVTVGSAGTGTGNVDE